MKREEFYREVRGSKYCPIGFDRMYKEFSYYQNLCLNGLRYFHEICEENDIPYQLAWGTLLGAVRDGGQIPWDYDVDVFVPYACKDNLIKALKKSLPRDFFFKFADTDDTYRHYVLRIAPDGYNIDHLHIDVFFWVDVPKDAEERKKIKEEMIHLIGLRKKRLTRVKDVPWNLLRQRLKTALNQIRYRHILHGSYLTNY